MGMRGICPFRLSDQWQLRAQSGRRLVLAMTEVKGPAVGPDAFQVVGHCCDIRIPAVQALTGDGMKWEFTAESKAELVAEGVRPAEERRDPKEPA